VLVGSAETHWTQGLLVGPVTLVSGGRPSVFVTPRYDGVRAGP